MYWWSAWQTGFLLTVSRVNAAGIILECLSSGSHRRPQNVFLYHTETANCVSSSLLDKVCTES